jgi:hypothetical protein
MAERTHRAGAALVVLVAAVLLFWRLGAVYLWQDEAMTAVLAERFLQHGKPLAYDGRNVITSDLFAPREAATIDTRTGSAEDGLRFLVERGDFKPDGTWTLNPWGQFLAAGMGLGVLGHNTAAARAPFALAALLTVVGLYALVRSVFRDRAVALVAIVLLVTNAFWILHARQCRYYALSSCATVATLAAFVGWQRGSRWGAPLFVAAAWCYFQCDFGSFFPTLFVLGTLAVVRAWPRPARALAVLGALALCVAPFAWYYDLLHRRRPPAQEFGPFLQHTLGGIDRYVVGLSVVAAAVVLLWRRRRALDLDQRATLWAAVGCIAATALWVPSVAPDPFHRYVVQLTPLAALLAAWVVVSAGGALAEWLGKPALRPVTTALVTALVSLTALTFLPLSWALPPPGKPDPVLRSEIGIALHEVFTPRPDPNRAVIEWIAPRLQDGNEVLVNYEDVPFLFYTHARIRGGIAAFLVEDRSAPPPRFAVLRGSVQFTHWPVFLREMERSTWKPAPTGAPNVRFGNCPDPWFLPQEAAQDEVFVAERAGP